MVNESSFKPLKITVKAHRGNTSAQGRSRFVDDIGNGNLQQVDRTMANGASRLLSFPTNSSNTRVITKLDRLEPNPWFGMKAKTVIELNDQIDEFTFRIRRNISTADLKKLLSEDRVKRSYILELRFDLEPSVLETSLQYRGTGHRIYVDDLDPKGLMAGRQVARSELENFTLSISREIYVATDETLRGALECELLLAAPNVAPSIEEFNGTIHHFYILNLEEAARVQAKTQDRIMEAISTLYEFTQEREEFDIHAIGVMCGFITSRIAPKMTVQALQQALITPGSDQEHNAETFLEEAKYFESGIGRRAAMLARYLTKSAENARVFVVKQGRWLWPTQKTEETRFQLGGTYEKVITTVQLWLDDAADDQEAIRVLAEELGAAGVSVPQELLV